jgi:hypothetical protein
MTQRKSSSTMTSIIQNGFNPTCPIDKKLNTKSAYWKINGTLHILIFF